MAVSERCSVWTGEESVLHIRQDLKLLAKLLPVTLTDGVRSPFIELAIPHRAVIGRDRGDSAKGIVRTKAVGKRSVKSLPLRICAVPGSIRSNKDSLHRTAKTIVFPGYQVLHKRGVRIAFDRSY